MKKICAEKYFCRLEACNWECSVISFKLTYLLSHYRSGKLFICTPVRLQKSSSFTFNQNSLFLFIKKPLIFCILLCNCPYGLRTGISLEHSFHEAPVSTNSSIVNDKVTQSRDSLLSSLNKSILFATLLTLLRIASNPNSKRGFQQANPDRYHLCYWLC